MKKAIKFNSGAVKRALEIKNFSGGLNTATDQSVLGLNIAQSTFNFDFSDGVLKQGLGIQKLEQDIDFSNVSGTINNAWIYYKYNMYDGSPDFRFMVSTLEGQVYENFLYRYDPGMYQIAHFTVSSRPQAINYRLYGQDVIIITTKDDYMYVYDGSNTPYSVDTSPRITSMALHYERLFVSSSDNKNAVLFSDDLDPTNFNTSLDEGGFIEMLDERGVVVKVISYQNYIYIFREYGISRLIAYSDQSDFSVSNLFVSSGKIYPNSVTLCGDIVLFLAEDGLYSFNGISTTKILSRLGKLFTDASNAVTTFYNSKFYIALKTQYYDEQYIGCEQNGEYTNNTVISLDINDLSYNIMRGVDIVALFGCADLGGVIAVTKDGMCGNLTNCGAVFDDPTVKQWSMGFNDLGHSDKTKRIAEIYVNSLYPITIKVKSEKKEKEYSVSGKNSITRLRTNISGSLMKISFISNSAEAYISKPKIMINYV